jgi:hypothetical protein
VHVSDSLLDEDAIPRRYADYIADNTNQFQPPVLGATLLALALAAACVAAFWFHDFDKDHPKERMAVRPVTIAAVLTLFGVAANWWFEITTVTAAVPLLLVALVITVICARVLGDGSRILLMCTAAVATLAAVSANRPATEAMEWSKTPASTAVVIGLVIVAAAAIGAIAPSRVVGYGLLLTVTVAGIVSYATSPSPKIGDVLTISDLLVAFTAAVVTYAIASAMYREPPRTGASRALVGLGVIFGPTALALLVYPQFDYGWTAYTPLDENKPFNGITTVGPFEISTDILILDAVALIIVAVCAYVSLRLGRINRSVPPPISRSDPSTPGDGTL